MIYRKHLSRRARNQVKTGFTLGGYKAQCGGDQDGDVAWDEARKQSKQDFS